MTDKTTSIERAAAMLGQSSPESAIERAARLMEQAKLDPSRVDPPRLDNLQNPNLPLDLDVLNQGAARGGMAARQRESFASPLTDRDKPAESKPITIDFESMSRRGLLSPLGEKTRIAEEYRLIKRFVLAKAFGRTGGRARNSGADRRRTCGCKGGPDQSGRRTRTAEDPQPLPEAAGNGPVVQRPGPERLARSSRRHRKVRGDRPRQELRGRKAGRR